MFFHHKYLKHHWPGIPQQVSTPIWPYLPPSHVSMYNNLHVCSTYYVHKLHVILSYRLIHWYTVLTHFAASPILQNVLFSVKFDAMGLTDNKNPFGLIPQLNSLIGRRFVLFRFLDNFIIASLSKLHIT